MICSGSKSLWIEREIQHGGNLTRTGCPQDKELRSTCFKVNLTSIIKTCVVHLLLSVVEKYSQSSPSVILGCIYYWHWVYHKHTLIVLWGVGSDLLKLFSHWAKGRLGQWMGHKNLKIFNRLKNLNYHKRTKFVISFPVNNIIYLNIKSMLPFTIFHRFIF